MTRKDYVLLASALRNARPATYPTLAEGISKPFAPDVMAWLASVYGVSDALMRDNARFEPVRFQVACGVLS